MDAYDWMWPPLSELEEDTPAVSTLRESVFSRNACHLWPRRSKRGVYGFTVGLQSSEYLFFPLCRFFKKAASCFPHHCASDRGALSADIPAKPCLKGLTRKVSVSLRQMSVKSYNTFAKNYSFRGWSAQKRQSFQELQPGAVISSAQSIPIAWKDSHEHLRDSYAAFPGDQIHIISNKYRKASEILLSKKDEKKKLIIITIELQRIKSSEKRTR